MTEIVINIDDKTYKAFMELTAINLGRSNCKGIIRECLDAIKHGVVLPKEHGRLIDADEFKNYCRSGLENVKPLFKTEKYCKLAIGITQGIIADVDEMGTIIEADKTESEGK